MPSARYLLVEGVDGHAVSDPRNPGMSPARYVGWAINGTPATDAEHVLEHYSKARQVVLDHADLQRAAKRSKLTILKSVVAKSLDEAIAACAAAAPKPTKPKAGDS